MIVTVPKDLYSHDGEEVVMEDFAIDVLEKLKNMNNIAYNEEDWAVMICTDEEICKAPAPLLPSHGNKF